MLDRRTKRKKSGKIGYMKEDLARKGECFGSHVERLEIDTRALSKGGRSRQQPRQRHMELSMPRLLSCLPKLASCTFDGSLYRDTLSHFTQIPNLKKLELRGSDWYLEPGASSHKETRTWIWKAWGSLRLDFRVLALCTSLHSLKVGRLVPFELSGLAEGVTNLPLIELDLSLAPWVEPTDPRITLVVNQWVCPTSFVFRAFCEGRLYSKSGRLPSTLEKLTLRDLYHRNVGSEMGLSGDISYACQDCSKLRVIQISLQCRESLDCFRDSLKGSSKTTTADLGSEEVNFSSSDKTARANKQEVTHQGFTRLSTVPIPDVMWRYEFTADLGDVLEGYEPNVHKGLAAIVATISKTRPVLANEMRSIRLERVETESVEVE